MDDAVTKFRAACVQLRSSDDIPENVRIATDLIREARSKGADFIATPENTSLMAVDGGAKLDKSVAEPDDPSLPRFRSLAEELGIWLLIGSLSIRLSAEKAANRSYLVDPKGMVAARYDKIHLFDVDLPSGESYRESATVAAGRAAVVAQLPWLKLGLTICYDLRFPQLYRTLANAGATLLSVPSAFTETTGKAHWHALLRARAIENGAFVIAPAQGGVHVNGRRTYGHSLVVSPWGEVMAEAAAEPGLVIADIDAREAEDARSRLPSLKHERAFSQP